MWRVRRLWKKRLTTSPGTTFRLAIDSLSAVAVERQGIAEVLRILVDFMPYQLATVWDAVGNQPRHAAQGGASPRERILTAIAYVR